MKILLVCSSLTSGGAERVLSTLANFWDSQGWEIDVFIISKENSFYQLNNTITLTSSKRYYQSGTLNFFRQLYDIRQCVKQSHPDVVISFLNIMNIATLLATIGLKTPIIISERNNHDSLKSKFWNTLRHLTYPLTQGMVVLSQYDFNQYHKINDKVIIFNPLDIKTLQKVSLEKKEKSIIAVGSLHPQKGFDLLIQALAPIKTQLLKHGWRVEIIGKGQERNRLLSMIEAHQLQNLVHLIGEKKNIFDYYQKASIFILSSRYEGFPNVLNEAMAHGCASVAFDCKTGPSEMIQHQINGLLTPAQNIDILGKNILKLVKEKALRQKFFYASIKIREKNSLPKISQEWKNYIHHIKDKTC
jgi:GalNAc-alpha-(1->4)-GalNAc-alpha-(1->3)-diNAcBac-PP-undecaprenol alpha-1,4-N-acetyl-D-galactosaminyltransferase